jgi:hypothetical protein
LSGYLQVWNWVMEPMLFATIGTSIVFAELPQGTIPKSVLVVCTGALAAVQPYSNKRTRDMCDTTASCMYWPHAR